MSEFYSYEGLRDGGTFKVDAATKAVIESEPNQIKGKVVTITGNGEAGYGGAGDAPLGFVEQVEREVTNSDEYVISVVWHQVKEDVPASGVVAGDWCACDGNGGVQKSEDCTGARVFAFEGDKAVVQMY